MKTATWDCDFSSLPYWENREHIPFIYDTFCEVPQSDALCCIYSIATSAFLRSNKRQKIVNTPKKPSP